MLLFHGLAPMGNTEQVSQENPLFLRCSRPECLEQNYFFSLCMVTKNKNGEKEALRVPPSRLRQLTRALPDGPILWKYAFSDTPDFVSQLLLSPASSSDCAKLVALPAHPCVWGPLLKYNVYVQDDMKLTCLPKQEYGRTYRQEQRLSPRAALNLSAS